MKKFLLCLYRTVQQTTKQCFLVFVVLVLALQIVPMPTASAIAVPSPVSAEPLPTVQVDGVVWATTTYGNTVYATGRFYNTRPAGAALGGAGTIARAGLLAFDATTGNLNTTFVHSLGGTSAEPCWGSVATGAQGCALAVSPDGKRLYVGGAFSTVDGQAHQNLAAIDLTTNKVIAGFNGTNLPVKAMAATNTMVYVGGNFTSASGVSRGKLAAYNANGTLSSSWLANVSGKVRALVVAGGKLIVGGQFTRINSTTLYSTGAVSLTNGSVIAPWAAQSATFPIRMQDPTGGSGTSVTSLSTDGVNVYLGAFTYIANIAHPGTFEGRAALRVSDGALIWMNDCVGDTYGVFVSGQAVYSAGHAHSCAAIDGFPEATPRVSHHGLAETTYATGKNIAANGGYYPNYIGQPSGSLYNWFPDFTTGTTTAILQAGWTVSGNSNYVIYGGEFTKVNGTAQQGLVRFGTRAVAPNKIGPAEYGSTTPVSATAADSNGNSTVTVQTTSDKDDQSLTYTVYRQGLTTPVASQTVSSTFWNKPAWTFVDTGLSAGETAPYVVVVNDPYGNQIATGPIQSATNQTPQTTTQIDNRYAADNGFRSALGSPVADEVVSGIVHYRDFAHGRAYWTERSGVHYVTGPLKDTFIAGGAHSNYGEPITDIKLDTVNNKGYWADFYSGRTLYYDGVGTREIRGSIRSRWIAIGRSANICGYPTTNELVAADGVGRYNKMSGDRCYIYFSAASGAHVVRGKIGDKWIALGGVKSRLKYPTSDEYKTAYGARSDFQGGSILWYSAKLTAVVVYK